MIYAFMRQFSGSCTIAEQRKEITAFALETKTGIDKEVIEYSSKNLSVEERSEFEKFVHSLRSGDKIVLHNLSVLSIMAEDVVKIVTCMISRGVELIAIATQEKINKSTTLGEFLPYLNDLRDAQKSETKSIGRPKGSKSNSKFDSMYHKILQMLIQGNNVSQISRELDVSRSSLKDYIESRGMRDIINGSVGYVVDSSLKQINDRLIICPFEK